MFNFTMLLLRWRSTSPPPIQIKTEIIASTNTAGGIVDYAEDKDVDLIVVGTRGRSGFKKILLGSVAYKVVTYSHCPVLVVR
jgi:nucleotide-binding universal stress UspA family protein